MSGRPARQRLIEDHLGGVRRDVAEELITDIEAQAVDRALAFAIEQVSVQQQRCHKPHFSQNQYSGRSLVEQWNLGVDSLAREVTAAMDKARHDGH